MPERGAPIEVRRFGVGHRRPDGPPGTVGIEAQVIESGASGTVAELAFGRRARIAPHSNPNTSFLIVIEGGGWVQVGDDRARIQAGEAAVWPPGIVHAAWTEGSPMRAIVVELPVAARALSAVVTGHARRLDSGVAEDLQKGEGQLAARPPVISRRGEDPEAEQGEPL